MRAHSGRSGGIQDIVNIANARSFRTPSLRPERTCVQDAQSGGRARIRDIQDGPGRERFLAGYPESVTTAILCITNERPYAIFRMARVLRAS